MKMWPLVPLAVTEADHSCPFTPANSFVDSFQPPHAADHYLPTFNSREMVDRIMKRKDQNVESAEACKYSLIKILTCLF